MTYRADETYNILSKLATQGWVPLINITTLCGYSTPVTIYQKQKGKNPIQTMRVGGTNRVYEDDVIKALKQIRDTHHAEVILSLFKRIKNNG